MTDDIGRGVAREYNGGLAYNNNNNNNNNNN